MSDQQRSPGYRGALPPQEDRMARPWVVVVIAIFVLMFVLAFLGFPSQLTPEATPLPLPSGASSAPAGSLPPASASASASPDASSTP